MQVFVSWSGVQSHRAAGALASCMARCQPALTPWVSAARIGSGTLWPVELDRALHESQAAILVVTRANLNAAWLLFEAGALNHGLARNQVCPILVDLSVEDLPNGHPLRLYQSRAASSKDYVEVLADFQTQLPRDQQIDRMELVRRVQTWWPEVDAVLCPPLGGTVREDLDRELTELSQKQLGALDEPVRWALLSTRAMARASGDQAALDEVDRLLSTLRGKSLCELHTGVMELVQKRTKELNETAVRRLVDAGVYPPEVLEMLLRASSLPPPS